MSGLVAYESSEEEDEDETPKVPPVTEKSQKPTEEVKTEGDDGKSRTTINKPAEAAAPQVPTAEPQKADEPIIGPLMGPAAAAAGAGEEPIIYYPPLEEDPSSLEEEEEEAEAGGSPASIPPPPGSPYTCARAAIRNLTLPPLPDTAIPPSPPGSPPRATTRKFAQFLELKGRGVHFNAKVAGSPALANPALADKLLAFVGAGPRELQYATTLPPDLWDPANAFPRAAFREQLRAAQAEGARERARGRGAAVDFVPAGAGAGASASAAAGPGLGGSTTAAAAATSGGGDGVGVGKRKSRFDK